MRFLFVCLIIGIASTADAGYKYDVFISTKMGPKYFGENITFVATPAIKDNTTIESGKFICLWNDDAVPENDKMIESNNTQCNWTVSYPLDKYKNKTSYQVKVRFFVGRTKNVEDGTNSLSFSITEKNNARRVTLSWCILFIFLNFLFL